MEGGIKTTTSLKSVAALPCEMKMVNYTPVHSC